MIFRNRFAPANGTRVDRNYPSATVEEQCETCFLVRIIPSRSRSTGHCGRSVVRTARTTELSSQTKSKTQNENDAYGSGTRPEKLNIGTVTGTGHA